MRDFEWQFLEDGNNDIFDNSTDYIESMTNDNEYYEDDYAQEDQELESWSNYYEEISDEIEY
jgi:hypothetical protein